MGKFMLGGTLLIMVIGFFIGSILWPYTLNTWLEYFGKNPSVTWWQGGLLGFVPYVGPISIPVAVITWIVMLFIK